MSSPASARLALSIPGFRYFWFTTLLVSFAVQIMSVSIAWQIYDVTGEVFLLGLVGLCLFLPSLLLILVTGLTADRFNRRRIMAVCLGVELLCALGFLAFVNAEAHEVWPIFGILVVLGTARAFWGPAAQSLAPNLVPPEVLSNAITTNATAWQMSSILGPAAGGLLYGIAPTVAFGTGAVLLVIAFFCVLMIPKPAQIRAEQAKSLETIFGASATSSPTASCWAPSRSTCSPCSWAAPWRCCRSMPRTSSMPDRRSWAFCAPRRASALSPWRSI